MKYHRALETKSVLLVYVTMALLALLADWLWKSDALASWQTDLPSSKMIWILGSVYVLGSLIIGSLAMSLFRWGQGLEKIFQQILTPISYFQIVLLSLLSGFVEEWFFRAVLSSHMGVILSAFFFALAHLIPSRKTWIWALWALQAGVVFGLFYRATQSLVFVGLLHSAMNFFFLLRLNNTAHRAATSHA